MTKTARSQSQIAMAMCEQINSQYNRSPFDTDSRQAWNGICSAQLETKTHECSAHNKLILSSGGGGEGRKGKERTIEYPLFTALATTPAAADKCCIRSYHQTQAPTNTTLSENILWARFTLHPPSSFCVYFVSGFSNKLSPTSFLSSQIKLHTGSASFVANKP